MAQLSEDEKWYRVSFRLIGDALPVDEIEAKLGIVPSSIGRKGEHIRGNPRYAKHQTNGWRWSYPAEPTVPFEKQITELLNAIDPKKDALLEILALPEVEGELFLGFSSGNGQGGAYFSPSLLQRIADYGLSLMLDLYPNSGFHLPVGNEKMSDPIKLMQVVGIFEVPPIAAIEEEDPWRFRVEVLQEYPSGKYIPEIYRWESFRVQPTFPTNEDGDSISELADDNFLIEDVGFSSDDRDLSGNSVEEVLENVLEMLKETFQIGS